MGRKSFISLILICLLALALSISCKRKEKGEGGVPAGKARVSGELHVLSASPKGPTSAFHESDALVVIFDQPMVPLESLPEGKGSSVLLLQPSFSGKHRWVGTKTLTFTPDERFPFSSEIRVTVPAGTRSSNGFVLKSDFSWVFGTVRPRLVKHIPQDKQKGLTLETSVLLVFNQPILKSKAKEFLSFIGIDKDNKDTPVDFSLEYPSAQKLEEEEIKAVPEMALLLRPEERLRADWTYLIETRSGLPAKEGPLGLEKGRIFSFSTYRTFSFVGLESEGASSPNEPLKFQFTNPVPYKEFVKKIHFEPAVTIPDYYLEWEQGNDILWISVPLSPETEYSIKIDSSLTDTFGNKLGKENNIRFVTAPFPASVSMTTGHGIIEAYGEIKYPLHVVNTAGVLFQGRRMTKDDVIPLLQSPKIFWSSEKYSPQPNSFEMERLIAFSLPRNIRQIVPLELKDLVPAGYGFVFFQLDTKAAEKWDRYPKALLQVTNLGISAKFAPENNLVWVTELKTGQPVSGADVEVRDDKNVVRWAGKTNAEGKVQTPGWKSFGLIGRDPWSKPQQWIFVSRGPDTVFISSEWGTGIDPYRFGIAYDWNPQPLRIQGAIFTERGIYRAGEKVHVKGILRKREKGQWLLPSAKEIECEVQDPFQKSVFKEKNSLDAFGSFSFDLETNEEAALGYYQIAVKVPPETEAEQPTTINESFRVEAFRPAEFEVHLRALKENFVFGEDYGSEIRSNYLFGGAMAGQKVDWRLRFNPAYFNPPGHKGYVFGNELDWGGEEVGTEESRLASSGASTLNAEGKLEIKLPLVPEKEKDSVLAALEATVQSPSRRSISSRIQTIVHRGGFYIGLKPQSTFLKSGEKLEVETIAATPEGTLVQKKKILLKLMKREWHSVRKAGIGGGFKWISQKEDIEVARQEIQTTSESAQAAFQPEKSGFYFLLAEAQDSRANTITTSTYLYVTGKDYVPWERRDDDTVELVADGPEYRPGDVAKILVKSPYEKAKALVTVERELILESKILDIVGSTTQIEIPITSDYMPNVFVSVLLVQGRSAPGQSASNSDVGKPSFKIGYVDLNVSPSEKQLMIDISTDKPNYKPKEQVRLKLNVKGWKDSPARASVTLAVVDVGVLNLIGYQTPHPFAQFYGLKPLSIETSETRLHVVGQRKYGEKGEEVGGGGEQKMMAPASLAETELRGDFKSTAYWNSSLLTTEQGEADVIFILPDNLTTFRVMAVAQTQASQFGRAETAFKVTKPLLLQASLPRFARLGDTFEGGVVIHNFSGKTGSGILDVEAKGIILTGGAKTRSFTLEAGQSKEILYSFEAEKPGQAVFSFRAQMGEDRDGLEVSLPLKEPRPKETVAFFDQTATSTEQKVTIPEGIYAEESRLEVQAAASAVTGLKGCLDYLADYPYLCLEQRISAVLPFIVASDVILDFQLSPLDKEQMEKNVHRSLKEIYSCQKEDGGFGLWPDSPSASPYISCYALFALIKAKEAGYETDNTRLEQAAVYLKNFLREKPGDEIYPFSKRNWRTTQAFALYDLALLHQPEPSYAEKLFSAREELSLFARTLLLKALHFGNGPLASRAILLQELLNKAKVTPTQAHFEDEETGEFDWIYSSNTRTTAFILQTIAEVGSDSPLLPQIAQWLVAQRKAGRWTSTQENFYVFYALNEYYRSSEKVKPDFRASFVLDHKTLLQEKFTKPNQPISRIQVPLSAFDKLRTLNLMIEKEGDGILFYGARMTYAPRQKLPPRDEGMAVFKKIESLDGKPLEAVKAGSLVVVTLQVFIPRESLFVAVEDPLPGGFEAVNPSFITESEEQQRALEGMEKDGGDAAWSGFNHLEMHDDRVLLFADSLTAGIHTHRYLARALSFGLFQTPGSKAEEMYTPEVFGRTPEKLIKIIR